MKVSRKLQIRNSGQSPRPVIIEPWPVEISLAPGSMMDLEISCDIDGHPYLNICNDILEIYLWSSCTCRISIDGVEAELQELSIPHP